jgi:predicted nucleotidyltransferase
MSTANIERTERAMNRFGLTDSELDLICGVLRRHEEVAETRIFGSRAKGCAVPGSDIDLALFGDIAASALAAIAGELDELPLPYTFDTLAYNAIRHQPLREPIDHAGQNLYSRCSEPVLSRR